MSRLRSAFGIGVVAVVVFFLTQPVGLAQAEVYVAGQVGANLPSNYSNVEWSQGGSSVSGSNLSLDNSVMYGGKLGYYFDSAKIDRFNLGIETEVYSAKANLKDQNTTIGGVPFSISEVKNRVTTWAPLMLVVRYQAGMLEPYAGVGPGVFFSSLSTGNVTDTSTDVGVVTQLGLRFRITDKVAIFGEWKFNHVSDVSHTLPNSGGLNISADYNANVVAFGAALHF